MQRSYLDHRHHGTRRYGLFLGIGVGTLLVVVGTLIVRAHYYPHTNKVAKSTSSSSQSTPSVTSTPANPAQPGDSKNPVAGGATNTSNGALSPPSGNFVSNHSPNLNGSPAPSHEESVCNTSPGASCQILFTQNDITRELPAQVTDRAGSTYWSWDLRDIGLTQGEWHIRARATLNGQTKTTDDTLSLQVNP